MIIIRNKEEFEKLMRDVDADLQKKNVPIHARELHGLSEVAKRLKCELICRPLPPGPIPEVYDGESLSEHISRWMRNRYGDRLIVDLTISCSVILLRGDPWLLRFPLVYVTVTCRCDRNLYREYPNMVTNQPGQPEQKLISNVLKLIEKLPQGLAQDLTDEELRKILRYYVFCFKFFNKIRNSCRHNELVVAALSDIKASAKWAVGNASDYGQSRWASLQAAEKLLKFFIEKKELAFPRTHELSKLVSIAHNAGLPEINKKVLEKVQCDAGVRYSQKQYSIETIFEAHKGVIQIGSLVMNSLYPDKIFPRT